MGDQIFWILTLRKSRINVLALQMEIRDFYEKSDLPIYLNGVPKKSVFSYLGPLNVHLLLSVQFWLREINYTSVLFSLWTGLPCRSTNKIRQVPRSVQQLSDQIVLHEQHPDHSPIRIGLESLRHLANVGGQVSRKFDSQFARCVVRRRRWWSSAILSGRWAVLLSLATRIGRTHSSGPGSRLALHSFHARFLRVLLENLDRSFRQFRQGCKCKILVIVISIILRNKRIVCWVVSKFSIQIINLFFIWFIFRLQNNWRNNKWWWEDTVTTRWSMNWTVTFQPQLLSVVCVSELFRYWPISWVRLVPERVSSLQSR